MAQGFEETLRFLVASASSVDQERTRLTREALLSFVQEITDQKMAVTFLADFMRAHDALEAAVMNGSPENDIAARRNDCLTLLDRLTTRH